MTVSSQRLTAVFSLLLLGVLQIIGAPASYEDDKDFQYFKQNLIYEEQLAESNLNSTRDAFINKTKTYNLPEDGVIESNLTSCFDQIVEAHATDSDADCISYVNMTVLQIISDSQKELQACTNFTYGWQQIGQVLEQAETVVKGLDTVVNSILLKASGCVSQYSRNPTLKINCFHRAQDSFQVQFNAASALAAEVYHLISGGELLVDAEVSSCQTFENFSLEDKCKGITKEVLDNCIVTPQ
ncbi:uncharacterized protein LOC128989949 [Macrosteles quadrilineatus]|uniref:uncharacterized protein LOC128989949 n=1 Tax=Macrosteles quadrilineatus TaxID=74068 RepID=UPI0023E31152|nr:uncharacterized protein LOC128989949 [Macrosteles quadrilineatus]